MRSVPKNDIVVLAIALSLLGAIFLITHQTSDTVTILRTERGFEPSRTYVSQGMTIVFTSATGKEFWPASDAHPTHGIYPEFDSEKGIKPGESWTFQPARVGTFGFHDHMDSRVTGTIFVVGKGSDTLEACLNNESAEGSLRAECWATAVAKILKRKGLDAAFESVAAWYADSPPFRRNCHDVMHIIGANAYQQFKVLDTVVANPETAYCGYGFYHGFVEAMLIEMGEYRDAVRYCDSLRVSENQNIFGACYHGIGHAVFDTLPSSLWGSQESMLFESLAICESLLIDPWERGQCVSGISNALANAMSAQDYGLSFFGESSDDVCGLLKSEYRPQCYPELSLGYVRNGFFTREQSFKFFASIADPETRGAVIIGFMDDEVRRLMERELNLMELKEFCTKLPAPDRGYCIEGIFYGLFAVGTPGKEAERLLEFCEMTSDLSEGVAACGRFIEESSR